MKRKDWQRPHLDLVLLRRSRDPFVCVFAFCLLPSLYNIHVAMLHIVLQSMNDNDAIVISYYEDDLKRYERNGTFSLHYFELV